MKMIDTALYYAVRADEPFDFGADADVVDGEMLDATTDEVGSSFG
jgi:hypothetical protein